MPNNHTYLIGEIGQNHNGSVDIAKLIIDAAARPIKEEHFGIELPGMDAVKLTKRDLAAELTDSAMNRPYDSPNSFGKTYGEHRAKLELSDEQHFELSQYAKELGLDFVETLCAIGCTSMLNLFQPDYLKVASRDLTNLPLLGVLASTGIPMIVSTGMAGKQELDAAVDTITRHHDKLTILHCVSQYPTHPANMNMLTIKYLQKEFDAFTIGFSDHSIGISAPVAAVAMGAKVVEKHITLDRRMKGTDQAGSLGPDGMYRMVRDIRCLDMGMGKEEIFIEPEVEQARIKLERSIATRRDIQQGEVLNEEDLHLLSPGDGYKWKDRGAIIGKRLNRDVSKNEIIYGDMVS